MGYYPARNMLMRAVIGADGRDGVVDDIIATLGVHLNDNILQTSRLSGGNQPLPGYLAAKPSRFRGAEKKIKNAFGDE